MLDQVSQRNNLLSAIEKARGSTVLAYMLHDNAMIADDALPQVYDKLQTLGRRERLDLLLYARGGVPEVAWRLLSLLREHCDHLGLIVGTRVSGAGSLLALGADEIVMGPLSELGGMESPRKHPLAPRDDVGQPVPILWSEIVALSGQGLLEQAGEAGSYDSLYPYVHPLVISHLRQADALSRDLARKALLMHMSPDDAEQVERIVSRFNGGFHSPAYSATPRELEAVGLPVTVASESLWSSVWSLVQLYQGVLYNDRPDQSGPSAFFRYVCMVETIGRTTGLRQVFARSEGQERVMQMGWETAIKGPGSPGIGPIFG